MIRRHRSELIGHERVSTRQEPQFVAIDENMLMTRHCAERAVAVRHIDRSRRVKFKPDSAAMTAARICRHYCAPIGLPGGRSLGAGIAAFPVRGAAIRRSISLASHTSLRVPDTESAFSMRPSVSSAAARIAGG